MNPVLFRNGALLDPRQPELVHGSDVLVEDGIIREVSDKPIKSDSARVIDVKGKTIMPGLIDLHVHVVAIEFNLPRVATLPNVLVTLRAVPIMRAMLRRGFTTVRDAGGAGHAFKQAVESGLVEGPRMFVSGRALSQTGGHADTRARSDYIASESPCGAACARSSTAT
jgi:imidazolonepropionase-like amidohydrolase